MILERNKSYQGDCTELMKFLPDESIDVICTDPPYLYLKNQKLDRYFDEWEYFKQVRRVLKPDGFIILFGRGASFYRWNTILADLGFNFKEEIVWDKSYTTSPLHTISRVHETVSIHSKGCGIINKVKIPYLEMKKNNIDSICMDIKRMRNILGNPQSLACVQHYLETGELKPKYDRVELSTTVSSKIKTADINASVMRAITEGMNEKTIIQERFERYHTIHPTQKPPRLIERLLALVCKVEPDKPKPLVLDTFRGSASTDIACMNFGVDCISFEIDDEYFESGEVRKAEHRKSLQPNLVLSKS